MIAADELTHSYTPRGVLRQLFRERGAEVLVSGPAGTGKSMACLEKLHMMALANPGMKGLIVRKTLVSLGSTALVTWRKRVVPEALKAGVVRYYGGSPEEPPQYRYGNGSTIVIGGMDRAIRIMSSEYDAAYVQEATEMTTEDWEAITTRLRYGVVPFQQLIADCNPDAPWHWLYQRAQSGRTLMLESRHEDNPTLFDEAGQITPFGTAYIAKLDALTGVRYMRLRKGLWVASEGMVYEDYDPAVHVVERFEIPPSWPRYWSVDFGYTNPFVLQCWAADPDGRLFLYRELYMTKKTVDEHAFEILRKVAHKYPDGWHWQEPKPQFLVCDHDAEGRAVLERELGLSSKPAHKAVTEGIQAVSRRLRPAGDGRARLFIMRDVTIRRDPELVEAKKPASTAEEVVGYVWERGASKAAAGGEKPIKENPVKMDDHGCDAMRYVVAQLDLHAAPRVRFI